jgi:hypothetical protein
MQNMPIEDIKGAMINTASAALVLVSLARMMPGIKPKSSPVKMSKERNATALVDPNTAMLSNQ